MMKSQAFLCLFVVLLACFVSSAQAYKFYVGGKDGWVANPKQIYNDWAEKNRFLINDILYFKYKKGTDSVLLVKKEDYNNCDTKHPLKKLEDGDSEFKLDKPGPFFFISGNPDHCQKGQKLIVAVLHPRTPPSIPKTPPPSTTPSPYQAPPPQSHYPPAPSPKFPAPVIPPKHTPPSQSPTNPPKVSPAPAKPPQSSAPVPATYAPVPATPPQSSAPVPATSPAAKPPTPSAPVPSTSPTASPPAKAPTPSPSSHGGSPPAVTPTPSAEAPTAVTPSPSAEAPPPSNTPPSAKTPSPSGTPADVTSPPSPAGSKAAGLATPSSMVVAVCFLLGTLFSII
ncbi:hypothetical protein ACOSP7_030818 [Xanthoceras sorbifolium]|uniref:Phytocyanin domain-containing protein n=1 Tax=Xanthoceras sorbifolium TaxID=99658 RepID=A0ABQ8H1M6_9ROSI|nr:hypothetical protein JRO89_XS15G0111600 [Xanthoceras sorbifolium]